MERLVVSAQFIEAGVQKLEPPIKAPDFALEELGGTRGLSQRVGRKGRRSKLFFSFVLSLPEADLFL